MKTREKSAQGQLLDGLRVLAARSTWIAQEARNVPPGDASSEAVLRTATQAVDHAGDLISIALKALEQDREERRTWDND